MARRPWRYIADKPAPEWAPPPRQVNWTAAPQWAASQYYPEWNWPERATLPSSDANATALGNPGYKRVYTRQSTIGGPFVPGMFPYGVGGRPATYEEITDTANANPFHPQCPRCFKHHPRDLMYEKGVCDPDATCSRCGNDHSPDFLRDGVCLACVLRSSVTDLSAKPNRGRAKLLKVPSGNTGDFKKTTRAHARGISAVGQYDKWPIGDAYHARMALIYALAPAHKSKRSKVLSAVARHYPTYDWASWWNREIGDVKQDARRKGASAVEKANAASLKPWSAYVKGASARHNPDWDWDEEEDEFEAMENPRGGRRQSRSSRASLKALYRKFHGPNWFENRTIYARYRRGLRPVKAR